MRRPPPPRRGSDRPTLLLLKRRLEASGIRLSEMELNQLWRYHELLRARNKDQELTRLIGFETIVTKHYIDSLIIGDFFKVPSPLLDIGTGAGFPGIPLKIRYPHLKLTLAEPRPRRVLFLREALQNLRLSGVKVFEHKVSSRSFQFPVSGVITRAFETMDKTCLRTSACLDKGGVLLFLKGPSVDPEIRELRGRFGSDFGIKLDRAYRLPHTPFERRLIVVEKKVAAELPTST